jgi:hypothetical protein
MQPILCEQVMAICANCYVEFTIGEKVYVDQEGDYFCKDCKKESE